MFIDSLYVYLLLEKCLFYPFVHFKIVLSSKHWTDKQLKNILVPRLLSKYIFKYFYSVGNFFILLINCACLCACTLMHGCAHSCVDQRTVFRSWFSFTMWAPGLNSGSQADRKPFLSSESSHRASFGFVVGLLWSMNAFSFWFVACDFDVIKETTVNIYSFCHGVLKFWFSPLGLCSILS